MPYEYPEEWERDETNLWGAIAGGHQNEDGNWLRGDDYAIQLFDAGWLQDGYSREDREAIRDAFFDYAIEEGFYDDRGEFDWQAWREYMDY